tara:strand:- start:57074 stop:57304 length:231 start_codon:yes stop_codon:yes gene_type:complete
MSNAKSDVNAERINQDLKWGEQNHSPEKWMIIIGEEFGETCKEILEEDNEKYREELVQLTASCLAALECFDRNKEK